MISFPAFTCKPHRDLPYNISKIAGGEYFAVILTSDGALWGAGYNNRGQLGTGGVTNTTRFTKFTGEGASGVTDVSCGNEFTIAIKNGVGYGCGYNYHGCLGIGTATLSELYLKPMTGHGTAGITNVACGEFHTIVSKSGVGYACGQNSHGENCNGGTGESRSLAAMTGYGTSGITSFSAGSSFTVINKSGVGYACGANYAGELGTGNTTEYHTLTAMTGNGTSGITGLACGTGHTVAYKSGVGYACGYNTFGQLGTGNTTPYDTLTAMTGNGTSGITGLSCGSSFTVAIKSGVGYGCGSNNWGNYGTGGTGSSSTLAAMNGYGTSDITSISAGFNFTIASKVDIIYGTGLNNYGQLGVGNDTTNYSTLTKCV